MLESKMHSTILILNIQDINAVFCLFFFPPENGICSGFTTITTKSLQSCPTLCDPIDGSPPGSPVPGILQAKTLEWIAISFSNA